MSSQKGNVSRTRQQKYQNATAFKNDKHDKSTKTKTINNLVHEGICQRCKSIIEWKIKYKKYKPLTQPATCIHCKNKCVRRAYHSVCQPCADKANICAKCNEKKEIVARPGPSEDELKVQEAAAKFELMHLPERKRRTVLRFIEKGGSLEEAGIKNDGDGDDFLDDFFQDSDEDEDNSAQDDDNDS